MSFYQLLFSRKLNGINRNLTWYWNLFAKYLRENVGTLLAKILKIKGNTLVWNQLEANNATTGTSSGITYTNNGNGSWTVSNTSTIYSEKEPSTTHPTGIKGHKYLFIGCPSGGASSSYMLRPVLDGTKQPGDKRDYGSGIILECTTDSNPVYCLIAVASDVTVSSQVFYPKVFDLTAMFGTGNEPNTVAEFTALFPLPYYKYDTGSLLNFTADKIKTVGKNVLDSHNNTYNALPCTITDITFSATDNGGIHVQGTASAQRRFYFRNSAVPYSLPYDVVVSSVGISATGVGLWGANKSLINGGTISANTNWGDFFLYVPKGATVDTDVFVQVEMGDSPTSYEPYTSSTKSLPISTYFPDGMLSAGSVYDELTPTSYVKRVGMVDLGSLSWNFVSADQCWRNTSGISNLKLPPNNSTPINAIHSEYKVMGGYYVQSTNQIGVTTTGIINCNTGTNLTKPSGYFYYELATPLENYGVVDLGSLTWNYTTNSSNIPIFYSSTIANKKAGSGNLICSRFATRAGGRNDINGDMQISSWNITDSREVAISDYQYNDKDTFKSAMSGVYLLYELVEPAVIDLDLSYEIEWGGTEQLLPENTSTPTTSPISATVEYPDGEHEDYYTYQEIEKNHLRLNRALSIMLGRSVIIENPQEPLNIIMRGE